MKTKKSKIKRNEKRKKKSKKKKKKRKKERKIDCKEKRHKSKETTLIFIAKKNLQSV